MPNVNICLLGGNITRDPETSYSPKGSAICKFGLAINRRWTSEAGEKKEAVTFLDVTAFGATAENVGKYFKKGSPILLEARAQQDTWDDKQTGQKRSKVSFIMDRFHFMDSKRDDASGQSSAPARKIDPSDVPPGSKPASSEPPFDDTEPPF